ncbi:MULTISPECIES: hypothetical protein [unclassified Mesorhizobium]|uniref:hypothetical protein n=1 Tax=unclassified Mesorhizobium TaxID=325217 RepID=UPI00333C3562
MQNDFVFKTGSAKRTLGWLVCLGAAGALAAMIYGIFTHPEAQTPAELWSGVVIGVFLVGLMVAGIAVQYARWSIEGENIIYRRLFRNKTIPLSELAGFGQVIVVVVVIPFVHVDLYDRELKLIARLPVSLKDWPEAEARLAARLRYVVNDGSPALPKRRFVDTPKKKHVL